MANDALDHGAFDIDLLTASLRADASDLDAFVENLAAKLEVILPGRVQVQRRRTGVLGPKLVRRIAVQAGDRRLELLTSGHGDVKTRAAKLSGGIVLKTETVEMEPWLAALGDTLATEAKRSMATREALERLLIR